MPAEAIHLSALADSVAAAPSRLARAVAFSSAHAGPARMGVMLVDLPYFHAFHAGLLRYLLKVPQAVSRWGDILHQQAPIALGRKLAEAGGRLRRQSATRELGQDLVALALGYISHAAVDTTIHPLVNRLAATRTTRTDREMLRQHQEIEKYQSILFHELRLGHDFMGTRELFDYVSIDWSRLFDGGPLAVEVARAMREVLGEAPAPALLASSHRGYRTFVRIISSPLGRRVAPAQERERERGALFDQVDFLGRFAQAVDRSRRWMETLHAYVEDGVFDDGAQAALAATIPEQTLDSEAEPERRPHHG